MAEPPRPQGAPRSRRLLVLAAVAVVVGGGYAAFRVKQALAPFEWSGTVEAHTITVGSRTGGRVKEVLAREGDRVTAHQPLVVLEAGSLDAQRAQAEAAVAEAEAALDRVKAGARPEEIAQAKARAAQATAALDEARAGARREDVAQAKAKLASLQAAADKATADAERSRVLVEKGALSRAEADASSATMKSAVADRDAEAQHVESLVRGTRREDVDQAAARASEASAAARLTEAGSRAEDVRVAEAQLKAASGRLAQVLSDIDELTIRAPRAARVESLDLRPGDILAPSAPAGTLLEDGELYVRVYIPETELGRVKIGQVVPVYVDSFPKRPFDGVVEHVAEVGEFSPRNLQTADERADQVFATRVGLKRGGEDALKAGMAAAIRVPK
jgi:multidrug resistance efflux pump